MIAFAAPWALIGLIAAGLPLLLHLVQRHDAPEILFPAVRYLQDATAAQQKRLKFHHWLLLLFRTLLIVSLVLAAAGMSVRRDAFVPHAPSALVLIIDNGAASSAVTDGESALVAIKRAANSVLDRATVSDRLWLMAADGVAHAGSAAELRAQVALLRCEPLRSDLGRAISAGRELLRGVNRRGEVVLVTPLQQSAATSASGDGALLVIRPERTASPNRGIVNVSAGLQPWSVAGGRVSISIVSSDTMPVPVTLSVDGRPLRDVLVTPGVPSMQRVALAIPGWHIIGAALPPDEFRLDDVEQIPVRVAPPTAVTWDPSDHFIDVAAQVLEGDGRVRSGPGVTLGTLGPGMSVVFPPSDAARIGALNRMLALRGSSWRFGDLVSAPEHLDSTDIVPAKDGVSRRYQLERSGTGGEVMATVAGAPWLVRSGDIILVGSRMDTAWTALPLSASFVPFLDAVVTRATRGDVASPDVIAGDHVRLPARTTAIVGENFRASADPAAPWLARNTGVFHLLAGTDTLGAIGVRPDPRVSNLSRATDHDVRALWPGATVAGWSDGPSHAFSAGGRGDLRGALLLLALLSALAETVLTSRARKRN